MNSHHINPPNYNTHAYASHIRDRVRVEGYIAALEKAMFPGAVVIDLGAGTGFFSLLAAQLGAGHVYAIEPNPHVELLAKQAEANGCAEQITIFQEVSQDVELPQKADILIADLRGGMFPLFQHHIPTLHDARQRFMKPDGVIIPERDVIFLGVMQHAAYYEHWILAPWVAKNYDVNMDLTLPYSVNQPRRFAGLQSEHLLLPGHEWATVKYGERSEASVKASVEWEVEEAGTAHALVTWFRAHLLDDITYTTAPDMAIEERPNTYGNAVYPLEEPVELEPGYRVKATLQASYVPNNRNGYVFTWETDIRDRTGETVTHFRQSDFFNQRFNLDNYVATAEEG